jgi:hypothetical protein
MDDHIVYRSELTDRDSSHFNAYQHLRHYTINEVFRIVIFKKIKRSEQSYDGVLFTFKKKCISYHGSLFTWPNGTVALRIYDDREEALRDFGEYQSLIIKQELDSENKKNAFDLVQSIYDRPINLDLSGKNPEKVYNFILNDLDMYCPVPTCCVIL